MTFIQPPQPPTEQQLRQLPQEPWSLRRALPWAALRIGCLPSCCAAIVGAIVGSSWGYSFGRTIPPKPLDPAMLPDHSWPWYQVFGTWGLILGALAGGLGAMWISVYVYSRATKLPGLPTNPEQVQSEQ